MVVDSTGSYGMSLASFLLSNLIRPNPAMMLD
jgi:hypothetical protein